MEKAEEKRISNLVKAIEKQFHRWVSAVTVERAKKRFGSIRDKRLPQLGEIIQRLGREGLSSRRAPFLYDEIYTRVEVVENHIEELDRIRVLVTDLINKAEEIKDHICNNWPGKYIAGINDLTEVCQKLKLWSEDLRRDYLKQNDSRAGLILRNDVYIEEVLRGPLEGALMELGPCKGDSYYDPVKALSEMRLVILQRLNELRKKKPPVDITTAEPQPVDALSESEAATEPAAEKQGTVTEEPKTDSAAKKIKEPSKKAIQAYLLYKSTGWPQTACAKYMNKELKPKVPFRQDSISRLVTEAKDWLEASGLDVFPKHMTTNILMMDPKKLEMGARQDGKITGDPHHMKNKIEDIDSGFND